MLTSTDHNLQAIYYYNHIDNKASIVEKLPKIETIEFLLKNGRIFSPYGKYMQSSDQSYENMHYLAPLNSKFKQAYIFNRAIPLPTNIPLYSILGMMLYQMGENSCLYIQVSRSNPWLTIKQLNENLPSVIVEELSENAIGWLCIRWSKSLAKDIARFDTIYSKLALHFEDFQRQLNKDEYHAQKEEQKRIDESNSAFIYSMHWALATSSLIRDLFQRLKLKKSLRGIDVGGSHGFLSCELAIMGHHVTNVEPTVFRVEHMLPWLSQVCKVSHRTNGKIGYMENLSSILIEPEKFNFSRFMRNLLLWRHTKRPEAFDFVCFMGSLLLCKREAIPDVLKQVKTLLRPGGLLIIRENLEHKEYAPTSIEFKAEELNIYLKEMGSSLAYYNHDGVEIDYAEVQKTRVVYIVFQKAH